jgi:hypothetical protein
LVLVTVNVVAARATVTDINALNAMPATTRHVSF